MKILFINGLKVNYEVNHNGVLCISFYSPYAMHETEKQKTIENLGRYLIAEGFVNLGVDEQANF